MGTPHPITGGPRDGDPPPKRPCTWVAGPHLSPRRFCFLTSIPPNLGLAEHGTRTPLPSLPGPPCCMSCSVPQFPPWPSMLPYVSALRGMATWPRRTSRAGPACSAGKVRPPPWGDLDGEGQNSGHRSCFWLVPAFPKAPPTPQAPPTAPPLRGDPAPREREGDCSS